MKKCILQLSSGIELRDQQIFYATNDLIIYKDENRIVLSDCSGEILSESPCPPDYRNYQCLDLDDSILFIFAGKDFLLIDKMGNMPEQHRFDFLKYGRIVTPLFAASDTNGVIFGTSINGRVQFINYDFIEQNRIFQSPSWDVTKISDMLVDDNKIYAVLDRSFIIACDALTGENLWNRFETGFISRKLLKQDDTLYYACQNVLKIHTSQDVKTVKIPMVPVSSLCGIAGDFLYLTTNDKKNLGCYDLKAEKMSWELTGSAQIVDAVMTKSHSRTKIVDACVLMMNGKFGITDLTSGRSIHYSDCPRIYKIHQTGNNILINQFGNKTMMIPGEYNV